MCELSSGNGLDCNLNGIPDECEYPGCPGIVLADMNCDGKTDGLDIGPFIDIFITDGGYTCQADMNQDGQLDTTDLTEFIDALLSGITLRTSSSRAWFYENLPGATGHEAVFTASVADDPLHNSSYGYAWEVFPPASRPAAAFTEISGGGTAQVTYAAPERPAYAPDRRPYVVRCVVTGDQYGNKGHSTFNVGVRVLGDTNGDGCADSWDRDFIHVIEQTAPSPKNLYAADLNRDGGVDGIDRYIAAYVAEDVDGYGNGGCN
jgi:hypothetical protein